MKEIYITNKESGISMDEISKAMDELLSQYPNLKKVLIIPPDFTRCYSYAGEISQILYKKLAPEAEVHVMPALGTHMEMDEEEKQKMIYVFDPLAERVFFIELAEIITGKELAHATCSRKEGEAPKQTIDFDEQMNTNAALDLDENFYGDQEFDMEDFDPEGFDMGGGSNSYDEDKY